MVLNSRHSLTAGTTLASVVSAVVLTVVGLCIPYTERAAKNRSAPTLSERQVAAPVSPVRPPDRAGAGTRIPQRASDAAPH